MPISKFESGTYICLECYTKNYTRTEQELQIQKKLDDKLKSIIGF